MQKTVRILAVLVLLVLFNQTRAAELGTVYGRVVERNPQGVLEGRVGITVELTALATEERRTILTDSDGCYEFGNLPQGSYKIEFKKEGYTSTPYTFELVPPEETLSIQGVLFDNSISVAGDIESYVINEGGQYLDLTNAKVKLSGVTLKLEREARGGEDGYFGFDTLPLGTYVLTIEHPDYERWSRQITLTTHGSYNLGQIILTEPRPTINPMLIFAAIAVVLLTAILLFRLRAKRRIPQASIKSTTQLGSEV